MTPTIKQKPTNEPMPYDEANPLGGATDEQVARWLAYAAKSIRNGRRVEGFLIHDPAGDAILRMGERGVTFQFTVTFPALTSAKHPREVNVDSDDEDTDAAV